MLSKKPDKKSKNQQSKSNQQSSKAKDGRRRPTVGRKPNNQNNSCLETLKRLSDLTSFIDGNNEASANELINLNAEDENTSIDIQNLKKRMNKLNLNNSTDLVNRERFVINNSLIDSPNLIHHSSDQPHSTLNSTQNSSFHNRSRLPSYVANGQPLGYKQPSINYQLHQSLSTNNFRSDSRLSNSSLVPSEVSSMHNSHLTSSCSNKNKKSNQTSKQCSAPNSLLATPSTSSPATPSDSRRSSKQMKKSESESFNSKDVKYFKSKQTASASTKQANLNNKAFRFEEYMPLCKVQNMLGKGQIVEVSD